MCARRLRRTGLALAACAATACVPDRPIRTPLDAVLTDAQCATAAREVLRSLGAGVTFVQAPPGPDGGQSVRIPTRRFAEWVALTVPDGAPPVASLLTPDSISEIRLRGDCTPMEPAVVARTLSHDRPAFTDVYLRQLVEAAAPAPLVVYVWSPHMPLSPDGWPEIERAAMSAGMRVAPALIAHGDRAFASREARRVGMPDEGLREVTSIELIARQAQVHAPSIVIFGTERVSPVLPGYRDAVGYLRYLGAFLEEH
jgi:hypothetical protein